LRKLKRVYFSHQYRNDPEHNRELVKIYCQILKDKYPHINIFAPHLYLWQLGIDDGQDIHNRAMEICLDELSRSDEMWIGSKISDGIRKEIALCLEKNIVYTFVRIIIPTKQVIFNNYTNMFDVSEKDIEQFL
jgi:hypothetical protein